VLVNSNPATIMTDPEMADRVYIEPITTDAIAEIIREENPDGVIAGLGGQTGLNVTAELAEEGVVSEADDVDPGELLARLRGEPQRGVGVDRVLVERGRPEAEQVHARRDRRVAARVGRRAGGAGRRAASGQPHGSATGSTARSPTGRLVSGVHAASLADEASSEAAPATWRRRGTLLP